MSSFNQALFNRAWSVTVGAPGQKGYVYSSFPVGGSDPSPLRIVFDIDKNNNASPNKGKIEVYNLNALSRLNYQKGFQILVQAGYAGLVSPIYFGDIPPGPKGSTSSRDGASIKTTFECGDAEKQLIFSYFDKTYAPGTRISQVFQDLANQLGVELGTIIGIQEKVYNTGLVVSGPVMKTLNTLTKTQKLRWSVQNGALQIVPKTAHLGDTAIVLSNQTGPGMPGLTGLIGVPSQGDGFISFSCLLNPNLAPDRLVQVVSAQINGYFKLRRTHFRGDSYGPIWQVDCEATVINKVQTYPQQNLNGRIVVLA